MANTETVPEKVGVRIVLTDLFEDEEVGNTVFIERVADQSLYADESIVDAFVDSLRGFGFDDAVIVRAFEAAVGRLSE